MKRPTFDELIARGVQAYQSGQMAQALVEFRGALKLRSLDAEAQSLCGLTLLRLGRFREAEGPLREAVKREPNEAGFRFNFVELLQQTQQFDRAAAELDAVIAKDPASLHAWIKLGDVRMAQMRVGDAQVAYRRALELEPEGYAVAVKLTRACAAAQDIDGAAAALATAVRLRPDDPATLRLQVEHAIATRNWVTLESHARSLTKTHPNEIVGWYGLSRALFEQGRYRAASQAYQGVLERAGATPDNLTTYARICMHAQDFPAATAALERAETAAPELAEMLAAKGLLLTYFGRLDEAMAYCQRCVEQYPDNVPVYTQLSRLNHGHFSDRQISDLRRLSADEALPVEHRISAAFALADGYDAHNDIERAFATYQRANAMSAGVVGAEAMAYDTQRSEARTQKLTNLTAYDGVAEGRARTPTPIFIVGMPRSGTTLVESILSAHSRVWGGGERGAMQFILGEFLAANDGAGARVSPADVTRRWIDGYYAEIAQLAGADHVTDKHPLNFEAVGLIARLFPNAKIIHIRRDPLETGLSIFRHEFTKFWSFAHRLEDIGHFYGQYARMVAHWQRALPDRFVTIQYEDLVADFDAHTRALIAACGLEWEPQCLNFQAAERAISTFSAVQAREPVTLRNGKAVAYRGYLGPLVAALEAADVDLVTGALRDKSMGPTASLSRGLRRLKGLFGRAVRR